MYNKPVYKKLTRYGLGLLVFLVALNAFAGGYYGMAGANDVPTDWLNGSPFHNYFIPGIILLVIVGGSSLLASILIFIGHPMGRGAAYISGLILLSWIIIQLFVIGYVSWMQPATLIAAILILFLTWKLKSYEL